MTSFKRLAFSTLAVGILWSTPAHATNVLVIIGDDIAVDKVSGYAADYAPQGYAPNYLPATPAIDGIGAAGLRFTRAWATPLCSPPGPRSRPASTPSGPAWAPRSGATRRASTLPRT